MTSEQRFFFQRAAFHDFIAGLDERELQLLKDDISLRQCYLESIKPENIIKNIMPFEDADL